MGPKPYYEHSGICIYHGDCREILPNLKADLLCTDPPYGIGLSNHGCSDSDYTIAGDEDMGAAISVMSWAESRNIPVITFSSPWQPMPGKWRNLLVWDKGESVGAGGDPTLCLKRTWELIQVRGNDPVIGGRSGSVLRFPVCSQDFAAHPATKPVELIQFLLHKLADPIRVIIDPFLGSGATLVAAKNLGRKAIGIEIEERYCELSAKRLSQEVFDFGEVR